MSILGTGFDHAAVEAVAALGDALDALGDAPLWSLPTGELGRLLLSVEKMSRRLDAARVALTAQAASAGVAEHEGATSLPAWLRAAADVPIGVTKARVALHHHLGDRPIVAAAFAVGDVGMDSAAAVCAAIASLPPAVPAALTGQVEQLLVDVACDDGTRAVVQTAADIVHRFAPEELEKQEALQRQRNALTLTQRHDGTLGIRGQLDTERAALALAVLGAHAAPRAAVDEVPDLRDAPTRYADALIDVLNLAASADPKAGRQRPHVAVTISFDALRAGLGGASGPGSAPGLGSAPAPGNASGLESASGLGSTPGLGSAPGFLASGAVLSAAAVRRMACDATIIPIVLGSNSEPLDIGRASRIWPPAIRRAIVARDGGCAMPGCDRPSSWCEIHHLIHWAKGGETSVGNGALVCDRHHAIVHHDGWVIRLVNGLPWFIPPPWVDAAQKPRLHGRFRTRAFGP